MKRTMRTVLCMLLVASIAVSLFAAGKAEEAKATRKVINLWSFTDEVPKMIEKFKALNPDFDYEVRSTIIATTDGAYQPALDQALAGGGDNAPDIYCAEAAFVLKYTQGDAAHFAAPYKSLGINVDAKLKEADIAPYTVDIGTNSSGDLVGLGYQATGGAFIYRRSIAKDVWGNDDPAFVTSKVGPGWDRFFAAAEELARKGYAIASGDGDIWHAVEGSSPQGWIVNDKLFIDKTREDFLDMSKMMLEKGYTNDTQDWTDAWFADMKDAGAKKAFGFFGPAWLINYVMAGNSGGDRPGEGTYGDWAVCEPPVGFFWGGTWVIANDKSPVKDAIGKIIEWITLDSSNTGLQYYWANGTLEGPGGTKDTVASGTVMKKSDGTLSFLGGQNMFDVFVPAGAFATGKNKTQYDETINMYWRDQVDNYSNGMKTKAQAIADFKRVVADNLAIDI